MLISATVMSAGCVQLHWAPPAATPAPAPAPEPLGGPLTVPTAEPSVPTAEPGVEATVPENGAALSWWARAMEAAPAARESMLRKARQDKSAWRAAMLRSIPGGAESEAPDASQEVLRGLLKRGLRDEEAALTRVRVAELEQAKACQSDVIGLRSRLNRIIQIEKDIGNGR